MGTNEREKTHQIRAKYLRRERSYSTTSFELFVDAVGLPMGASGQPRFLEASGRERIIS